MASSVFTPIRNARTLAGFVFQTAPMFWKRLSEDRRRVVEPSPSVPNIAAWPAEGVHAAWIGHSTVLIRVDGFTILTDPVFSTRVGIKIGPFTLGIKRLVQPALHLKEMPVPDLILLSHAHMDHLDRPSLRKLENRGTTLITAAGTSDLLRVKRYRAVHELRWEESCQVGPAKVRAFEVKHWGARTRTDVYRGYNGYLIEAGRYRILFGGDTAFTDSFRKVRSAKPVDLAIMPIGAYNPWIHAHCNPEQALAMANQAGAEFVLPVHHKTFKLSSEPYGEPIERLLLASGAATGRIAVREIGDEFHLCASC
ncbi:MAG TPA: MBL fold metallo-hydrolase [Bryobacteraceae bacterium]|jgi:L-ascorbate metabolism protein UlaG (beta-lactamase superfamily)